MSRKRLLLVDDEPSILMLLERMMASQTGQHSGWEVRTAPNGEKALAIMQKTPVDVILSDYDMPGIDGATLLDQVAERYPDTVRMIFSGSMTTGEHSLRLLESTHQVFVKPQSLRDVRGVVGRAFAVRDILPEKHIEKIVTRITTLPSLPDLYMQLVTKLKSSDCSLQEVGAIIEQDLAMSAKVLQLVNSAFFGLRQPVSSPSQAASLLGIQILKSLVLMANVFSQFDALTDTDGFSLKELWRHGLSVGACARNIARIEGMDSDAAEESFVCGLFHDIGKLVLLANMSEEYGRVLKRLEQHPDEPLVDIERDIIGASHAEVGAYLLGIWGFSEGIIEAAAYHHDPSGCRHRDFSALTVVHAANVLDYDLHNLPRDSELDMPYLEAVSKAGRLDQWREICGQVNPDEN
jgi:putative nucleotidyltransferase with HDIG domain